MQKLPLFSATILFFMTLQPAHADLSNTVLFTLNTIYLDRDYSDNGVTTQAKSTDTDIRLGKIFKNYYAGAIYSQSSNDASDANRTSYGISTGFFFGQRSVHSSSLLFSIKIQSFKWCNRYERLGT